MKKILYSFLAITLLSSSLFSAEWGGRINNNSAFFNYSDDNDDANKYTQTNDFNLWATIPLNASNTSYLALEGLYRLKYEESTEDVTNIADLSLFKYSMTKQIGLINNIAINAGRYSVADVSSKVFQQTSDGLMLSFKSSYVGINAYGGYTGLLNTKTVTMLTPSDSEYEDEDTDIYSLAPKYIPFYLAFNFPKAFANQQLSIQALGFADLNGDDYNRYYAELGLNGYLSKALGYDFVTVFGSENFDNITNLSNIQLYIIPAPILRVTLGALYASGETGPFESFVGFTSMVADLSYNGGEAPQYSGMLKFNGSLDFTILNAAIISAGPAVVFDWTEDSPEYKGTQAQIDVSWNVFTDFNLGAGAYYFFGKEDENNKGNFTIKASFSF